MFSMTSSGSPENNHGVVMYCAILGHESTTFSNGIFSLSIFFTSHSYLKTDQYSVIIEQQHEQTRNFMRENKDKDQPPSYRSPEHRLWFSLHRKHNPSSPFLQTIQDFLRLLCLNGRVCGRFGRNCDRQVFTKQCSIIIQVSRQAKMASA